VFKRTPLIESLERPREEASKLRAMEAPSVDSEISPDDVRRQREALIKEQVRSLLRKMEV